MYEHFFRFSERPFAVLPDSRRIFWTDGHRNALSVLEVGFERLSQVSVLTGGIGTGKTTLIRHLLQTTSGAFAVGLLSNFVGGRCDLLSWVLSAFGLDVSGSSETLKFRRLETFLEGELYRGRRSVLIVDEAQNLSERDLESLRLLSNINAQEVLMMLVLVGQPQLRAKLTHIANQHLCHRIGADYHLEPLSQQETAEFVRYRCVQAGGSPNLFDEQALDEVHRISSGVPRKINVLCDLALVSAYGEGVRKVDCRIVRSVVEDARRHGTYMSLTESDSVAMAADPGATADTGNKPDFPESAALRDPVQRLMHGSANDGADGRPVRREIGANDAPAAPARPGSPPLSARANPAGLRAPFEMDWSDDTLPFLDELAEENAASAVPAVQADAPSSGDRPPGGAGRPADHAAEAGGSGPTPHPEDDGDDLPIRAAAGAEPILHDSPAPHPMSAAASACRLSRGELALRQAFGRQPAWRRTGWRGAAVAAFAAGSSMAAGIAITLLPDGTASVSEPATEARRASPERVAVTEAPSLPINMVRTFADPPPALAGAADVVLSEGLPASSGTAVAERPSGTDDWSRFSPVALAYEDARVTELAAAATTTISSPRRQPGGTGAPAFGAMADDLRTSIPQPVAADRQPTRLEQPHGLSTPDEAAGMIPFVAPLHGDAASPLTRHPVDHASALAAPGPIEPAPQVVVETHAARAGSVPEAAPGIATRKAEPASASVSSEPRAVAHAEAVPQIIATTGPPAGNDPEALFRDAVDIAIEDSRAGVIGYARAALLGHARAAYYLGQIYETGDGVPVDFAIARHWYEAASDGNRRAENRLADLPRPQGGGLMAPLPLLAQPLDARHADFVWTSGEGADPTSYVVEISLDPKVGVNAAYAVTGSAARLPLVEGATHWRVRALDATGERSTASDWRAVPADRSDRSAAAEVPPDHL